MFDDFTVAMEKTFGLCDQRKAKIDKDFILAGNAIFTVANVKTGNRFTFRVQKPSDSSPHFVQVLTGPDNTNDYTFLGTIFGEEKYYHGKKSPINFQAKSAVAFAWLWNMREQFNNLPEFLEINHEGYCGRCGRLLTTPESVETGIGPVCKGKM